MHSEESLSLPSFSNFSMDTNSTDQPLDFLVHVGRYGPPLEYAMPLYGYAMPPLMILTIVANTFVAVVLSQRHMITPTNIVLLAMAVCDMFTLTFPAPWFFYLYTMGNHKSALGPSSLCLAYHTMCEMLPNTFRTTSIWLTVLLAVQRYIYICHPTTARTVCTVPNVCKTIVAITCFAFGHMIPKFFDVTFYDITLPHDGNLSIVCAKKQANWLLFFTPTVFYNVYYSFKMVFVNLIPCIVLVVLNILLFLALRRAKENKMRLQDKNKPSSKRNRDSQSTTLMLIVVVTMFLATEIPLTTVVFIHALHNNDIISGDYKTLNTILTLVNFSLLTTYPLNFAIYCGMSKQFRNTFRELFITGWLRNPGEPTKAQMINTLETTI
ncbi:sex peptide receptor [Galendromus occidentalis]|uniref:Sex peptide receptor n=1 Tax=Galendromus occidentalis TaxID=34638 RepID=A0AAJ6QX55_9ACAR|nr:sex peptide receptor [Galendromus occidentalis]